MSPFQIHGGVYYYYVKQKHMYRTSRSKYLLGGLPLLLLYSNVDIGPGVLQRLSRLVVSRH